MGAPSLLSKTLQVSGFVACLHVADDSNEEEKVEVLEIFEKPQFKELEMEQKWTMWEHYEMASDNHSFEDSMSIVCWFNDFVGFAKAWNYIPHRKLKNFFYDG